TRHSTSLSFDTDDVLVDLIISSEQSPCAFLLAKLLNFQGTSPRLQVGSLSNVMVFSGRKVALLWLQL
ncbi:hypothetical protein, partial [Lactobacillus delbrueckii]|uniref:hypothetical protein n=1 Tax=Lactobacillus delbrueckii TaxID=1584 RepID=UPI001C63BA8D